MNATTLPPPGGCRHCGIPERAHARQWTDGPGWHPWTRPTPEQLRARLQRQREDRSSRSSGPQPGQPQ